MLNGENEEVRESEVYHEFDYSNAIVDAEIIGFLIQYSEHFYKKLLELEEKEEERNKTLRNDFIFYEYKKHYNSKFEVIIKDKENYRSKLECKSYESYAQAVKDGQINNLGSLVITLDLSYKRGKYSETKDYENVFIMSFKPYEIKFIRKSNHNEEYMNQIEGVINEIFKKFKVQNTIFCTK